MKAKKIILEMAKQKKPVHPQLNDEQLSEWISEWEAENGSAIALWGTPEMHRKIYDAVQAGHQIVTAYSERAIENYKRQGLELVGEADDDQPDAVFIKRPNKKLRLPKPAVPNSPEDLIFQKVMGREGHTLEVAFNQFGGMVWSGQLTLVLPLEGSRGEVEVGNDGADINDLSNEIGKPVYVCTVLSCKTHIHPLSEEAWALNQYLSSGVSIAGYFEGKKLVVFVNDFRIPLTVKNWNL